MCNNGSSEDGPDSGRASVEGEDGPRLFIDAVFLALADWRRRKVCEYFLESDEQTASVGDLAVLVAASAPTMLKDEPVPSHGQVVTQLKQRHLPVLAEAGVIDYDHRTETVSYWGQPTVEKWLEHVTIVDDRCRAVGD